MKPENRLPIIIIQGPTAVGKSKIALELAEYLNTEIISADSRQVYRFMDIGTAKPSKMEQARIPHHLIDVVTPDERYNAGRFAENANLICKSLLEKRKIPIVVGGTGFYIKSLLEGLFQSPPIPEPIKTKLASRYETEGFEKLYKQLQTIDPESAKRIAKNDKNRILRALEIFEATGKSISEHWKEQTLIKPYQAFNILLEEDRSALYKRINQRVLEMLEEGLIVEFQTLLERGYTKQSPGMNTVGYKEFFPFVEQKDSLQNCIKSIQQHTRHYAKRQFTWYRRQEFDLTFQTTDITFSTINKSVKKWLKNTQWEL